MKTEKESFSFGRYLQMMRLEKKIKLQKVSEETRIAISNLRLIEKEDLEALPDEVFVKGFLRSYARAIGADKTGHLAGLNTDIDRLQRLAAPAVGDKCLADTLEQQGHPGSHFSQLPDRRNQESSARVPVLPGRAG